MCMCCQCFYVKGKEKTFPISNIRLPASMSTKEQHKFRSHDADTIKELQCRNTFKNWAHPTISIYSLILAGFHYHGPFDVVQCESCKGIIGKWNDKEIPWQKHIRLFPNCPRFLAWKTEKTRSGESQPKPSNFSSLEARMDTFTSWPISHIQAPQNLAQAGFYYENFGHEVRCFSCNLVFCSWNSEDIPLLEHMKCNPNCGFINSSPSPLQETDGNPMKLTPTTPIAAFRSVSMSSEASTSSVHSMDPAKCYNMNHKNRGRALIFNHEEFQEDTNLSARLGTSKDCEKLDHTFKKLGFDVAIYRDCKRTEIFENMKKVASEDHTNNDCLLIVILSHGDNDKICAYDEQYELNEIAAYFTTTACPTLQGKPKLFFIQACRGKNQESRVYDSFDNNSETDGVKSFITSSHKHADFLYMYSSIEGFVSYRSREEGSWFIQALVDEFNANATKLDFLSVLTLVAQRVASKGKDEKCSHLQLPSVTTRLTSLLRFTDKNIAPDYYINTEKENK